MEERIDLHIHSCYSDGTNTPRELIKLAQAEGLKAVALCDHNTISGLKEFCEYGRKSGVIPVPGVEVSSGYNNKDVHILGFFTDESCFDCAAHFFDEINNGKIENNITLAENLQNGGFNITYDEVMENANGAVPNRVHFAKVLIKKGYISSVKEGFLKLLSENGGYYIPTPKKSVSEVVGFLKSVKAIPVVAHPLISLTEDELDELFPEAVGAGLKGLECLYSLNTPEQTEKSFAFAKKYGLCATGGSDFHGENKPEIKIGVGKGNLDIPYELYLKLYEE